MKVQSIILIALLCSSTFAADTNTCSGILSSTCGSDCQFTPAQNQTYCLSKCDLLSLDQCSTNPSCTKTDGQCLSLVNDCDKIQNVNKQTCQQHNNACVFQDQVNCSPLQGNNKCTNLTSELQCQADTNCAFTLNTQSCAYNNDYACNDTCSNAYCSTVCSAKTQCAGGDQNTCEKNKACKWDAANNACNDNCPANCDQNVCNSSCQLNKQQAQTDCPKIDSDGNCALNKACLITSTGTCTPSNQACSTTNCPVDYCQQPQAATCSNPKCSNDITNCGTGCFASPQVCIAAKSTQCLNSFNTQSNCESQGCRFVQFGTCATKPNSNSAVIVFTLLNILIAFMF
ncbi:hypothetical protein ABPG74_007218 [Tetrahymena malaccensis]